MIGVLLISVRFLHLYKMVYRSVSFHVSVQPFNLSPYFELALDLIVISKIAISDQKMYEDEEQKNGDAQISCCLSILPCFSIKEISLSKS